MKKNLFVNRVANNTVFTDNEASKLLHRLGAKQLLSVEEETRCGEMILKGGKDAEMARKCLWEHNLRAAYSWSKQFCFQSSNQSDFLMKAAEALWTCACNYDPSRGMRFIAYASSFVKGALMDMLNGEMRTVKGHSKLYSWVKKYNELQDSSEMPISAYEFAEEAGCTIELAFEVVNEANGMGGCVELEENSASTADSFSAIDHETHMSIIYNFLDDVLKPEEKEMWMLSKGLKDDFKMSYDTLAEMFHKPSADSVRKTINRVDAKLKAAASRLAYLRDEVYGIAA